MSFLNKYIAFLNTEKSNKYNNVNMYSLHEYFNPHGHSLQSAAHFIQIYNKEGKKYFKKFDFGEKENMKK